MPIRKHTVPASFEFSSVRMSASNESSSGIARAIDANLNRAAEALRVLEDVTRFSWNDSSLTEQLKKIRHSLAQAKVIATESFSLILARESQNDVGRTQSTSTEYERSDIRSIIQANWNRVQQSLRSLEEHAKMSNPDLAKAFETLRYRCYHVHKTFELNRVSRAILESTRVCVLLSCRADRDIFASLVKNIANANEAVMFQLRDKTAEDEKLVDRGHLLDELLRDTKHCWAMNDRVDLAMLCQPHGVQLGQEDLSIHHARELLGPDRLIGKSTHDIGQVYEAIENGANYLGIGPMFPSQTKCFNEFPGVAFAEQVCQSTTLPAFAIGGITLENIDELVSVGVKRVAVSGAVSKADDPGTVVKQIHERLSEA